MYNSSEDILIAGLMELIRQIIKRSEAAGQRASGKTYSSMSIENISQTHAELHGPAYLGVLEDGRKPGKVPYNFVEIIKEWATWKGISWASADPVVFEKWANGVKWSIIRKGTKLYREGTKLDVMETPIKDFEAWIVKEMSNFYAVTVADTIRTAWQEI